MMMMLQHWLRGHREAGRQDLGPKTWCTTWEICSWACWTRGSAVPSSSGDENERFVGGGGSYGGVRVELHASVATASCNLWCHRVSPMKPQSVVLQSRCAKKKRETHLFFFIFTVLHLIPVSLRSPWTWSPFENAPNSACPLLISAGGSAHHVVATQPATFHVSERYCLSVHSVGAFFWDTPQLPAVGVCAREWDLCTPSPSPLFSIIFGTHNHPGENPGLSQSSNTGCFGPAPSPLWFTVQIPFSVCVSVYLLHANPVWSVLLFIAVFFVFFYLLWWLIVCLCMAAPPPPGETFHATWPSHSFFSSPPCRSVVGIFAPPTTTLPPRPLPDWQT